MALVFSLGLLCIVRRHEQNCPQKSRSDAAHPRIPFALISHLLLPNNLITAHQPHVGPKWKLLDLPGSFLILAALMLLNVGLTLGASKGWDRAEFMVPTILSLPLAIAFFFWERYVGEDRALLPSSVWRINNMMLMCFAALFLIASIAVSRPQSTNSR